jgi:hypothetical protein
MPASVNKFLEPDHYDHQIGAADEGGKVGELRIKPSSILWKPKNGRKYFSVSLEVFAQWIEKEGKSVDR